MTWPLALLLAAVGLLLLVGLIVAVWFIVALVTDSAEDEPYEYQPLYLVTREDR